MNNALMYENINRKNPVIDTFETIDAYLCRRIRFYTMQIKSFPNVYYAGKLQALVDISKLLIDSSNVQMALDAMDDIAFYAEKLENDFNVGMARTTRHTIRLITSLKHDMTQISFEEYRTIKTEHYRIEYLDNDGDMLMFADNFNSKRDAIEDMVYNMYAYDNLVIDSPWHFSKALLVHVYGDSECIEMCHSFKNGVYHLMQEMK